jgi:hypothetical protein
MDSPVRALAASSFGGYQPTMSRVAGIRLAKSIPNRTIDLDIKPESDTNPINLTNSARISVAILTTPDFDASTVNVETVCFGANPPDPAASDCTESHLRGHTDQDVDADGDFDLVLHFDTSETGIAFGDTEAFVTGYTVDGIGIEGRDFVRVTPSCGIGFELAFLLPPLIWARRLRLRSTNDADNPQDREHRIQ